MEKTNKKRDIFARIRTATKSQISEIFTQAEAESKKPHSQASKEFLENVKTFCNIELERRQIANLSMEDQFKMMMRDMFVGKKVCS